MCKEPNKSKITTFLRQCLTSTTAKADLSALYSPSDLSVEQVELEDMRTYHVYARCNLPHGVCPYCGHVSRSVHSRYHRTIADLSILGHPVIITFEARKFFCHNPDCRKKTFAEQPGDEVFRYLPEWPALLPVPYDSPSLFFFFKMFYTLFTNV